MKKISVCDYEVIIGEKLNNEIKDFISSYNKKIIITDDNLERLYLDELKNELGVKYSFVIEHGEENKSFENYEKIVSYLLDLEFNKEDLLIAFGGGVVSDLVGYVASTYKRGCNFISIPTTTLAQIDASVGGKNAINMNGIKNSVGSFYNPKKVFADTYYLNTLDRVNKYGGLVEGLKMGLIGSNELFCLFNKDIDNNIEEIITKSIEFKKKIVEEDYKDEGKRHILNFGHTIGHAIEEVLNINHGYSVAIGMIPFIMNEDLVEKVLQIYDLLGINIYGYIMDASNKSEEIYKKVLNDKKASDGYVECVILNDIENVNLALVDKEELKEIVENL